MPKFNDRKNVNNIWNGSTRSDVMFGNGGSDRIHGMGGNDEIHGGADGDWLYGDAGNDRLYGGAGADTLDGGDGDDLVDGGAGADSMAGGAGDDTYYVDDVADVVTELTGGGNDTVRVGVSGYILPAFIENIIIEPWLARVTLTGNAFANTLVGTAGNDTLNGGDGDDTLSGGAGNDMLDGGSGNDSMSGGSGDDIYIVDSLSDVVSELAGEGIDLVRFAGGTFTLGLNIENGEATGTLSVSINGNALDNILTGNSERNDLVGMAGNDTLDGGSGNDSMSGGSGDDTLFGGSGNDYLVGGFGADTLYAGDGDDLLESGGDDVLAGGPGNDRYVIGAPGDTIIELGGEGLEYLEAFFSGYTLPDNVENGAPVTGTPYATMYGNAQDNVLSAKWVTGAYLYGMGGNDTLNSDSISFTGAIYSLYGGDGDDTLNGSKWHEELQGDAGADSLWGAGSSDLFVYMQVSDSTLSAWDTIQDFSGASYSGEYDTIDLSNIDANTAVAGDQAFSWVLFSTGAAGQAWTAWDGTYTHLYVDVDGGGADMRIDIVGNDLNVSTDFIW